MFLAGLLFRLKLKPLFAVLLALGLANGDGIDARDGIAGIEGIAGNEARDDIAGIAGTTEPELVVPNASIDATIVPKMPTSTVKKGA
jgi:hypothetical protein